MAEQTFHQQCIAWGRLPDGRFFINLDMQIQGLGGKIMRVPVTSFTLTKPEEEALKASLTGLHIVMGNGRN